jgi:hypothetical protein
MAAPDLTSREVLFTLGYTTLYSIKLHTFSPQDTSLHIFWQIMSSLGGISDCIQSNVTSDDGIICRNSRLFYL